MSSAQETLVGFVSGSDEPSLAPLRTQIGDRYEIVGLLGQGGMGTVYRVRDLHLDEQVALKQLRPGLLGVSGMRERFRQEVKLARRITHPNVVRIFDVGEVDGQLFLTMELVEGQSLARRLREGWLPTTEAVRILRAVVAGVEAAHRVGVVHCDLKPDNVLLGAERVAVADFGLARAVGVGGQIAGTPAYMAPEQVTGGALGPFTDQYALGAILYEALTGVPAWPGDDPRAVAMARLQTPAPDPRRARVRVSDGLAEIVLRALAPISSDRFPDLGALDDALAAIGRGGESIAPRAAPSVPLSDAVSVAVLVPRAPVEDAGLALTLAEDLVDALGATRGLRVRPLSGLPADLPSDASGAGRLLGAAVVVEGALRRTDAGVRWTLRAVGAADGYQVWSGRYEATHAAVLGVVDLAAAALASALANPIAPRAVGTPRTAGAVDAYVRIRGLARSTWGIEIAEVARVVQAALTEGLDDPLLLACQSQVYANLAFRDFEASRTWVGLGRAAAHRALERAPLLADAWLGLARNELMVADFPAATAALRQALELTPGLIRAQEMFGAVLLEVGEVEEATLRLEAVLAADPSAHFARNELVRALIFQGRWARADALLAASIAEPGAESNRVFHVARFALWRRPGDPVGPPLLDAVSTPGVPQQARFIDFVRGWQRGERTSLEVLIAGLTWVKTANSVRFRLAIQQVMCEAAGAVGQGDLVIATLGDMVADGFLDVQWLDHAPMLDGLRERAEWHALRGPVAARAAAVRAAISAVKVA